MDMGHIFGRPKPTQGHGSEYQNELRGQESTPMPREVM